MGPSWRVHPTPPDHMQEHLQVLAAVSTLLCFRPQRRTLPSPQEKQDKPKTLCSAVPLYYTVQFPPPLRDRQPHLVESKVFARRSRPVILVRIMAPAVSGSPRTLTFSRRPAFTDSLTAIQANIEQQFRRQRAAEVMAALHCSLVMAGQRTSTTLATIRAGRYKQGRPIIRKSKSPQR